MSGLELILAAVVGLALSGLPGALMARRQGLGQGLSAVLTVAASATGLVGVARAMTAATPPRWDGPWGLPMGSAAVAVDALSAWFLVPVLVVPALAAVYGLGYRAQSVHAHGARTLAVVTGVLAAAMAVVVVARDGVLLLVAWEVMAVAAFFAVTADDHDPEVCRAGRVYLVCTHLGTLALVAMMVLWRQATGSFALVVAPTVAAELAGPIFVLALVGFGMKAGIVPLHLWLPGAHANAPSPVSAVMSGVMLKIGVYGLVRMTALVPTPERWQGGVVLAVGAVTALVGITFALAQDDLKRVLAYSSVENVGVIACGLGLGLLGRASGHPEWVLLGLAGALLHVWNHSLFKSLLFFAAGAVVSACGGRDLGRMGGLGRRQPRLMLLFVIAAVAASALPPLNGFASEWLLYVGLFRTLGLDGAPGVPAAAVVVVAVAMTGALAVACFVRLVGVVFLGAPRRAELPAALVELPATMHGPMVALAAACVVLGLAPMVVLPPLERAAAAWAGSPLPAVADLAPLVWISGLGLGLVALAALAALAARVPLRRDRVAATGTWDCGYAQPTARMQYTASSFSQSLAGLASVVLWPRTIGPGVSGRFAAAGRFATVAPDVVLARLVQPLARRAADLVSRLHVLHAGQTHVYVLYVLFAIIVLLAWGATAVHP